VIAVENQFTEYQRSFKKFRERLDRQAMPRLLFAVRLVVKDSERITLPVSRATLHSARIANSCLQIFFGLGRFRRVVRKIARGKKPLT
jgi:hypothetical protein